MRKSLLGVSRRASYSLKTLPVLLLIVSVEGGCGSAEITNSDSGDTSGTSGDSGGSSAGSADAASGGSSGTSPDLNVGSDTGTGAADGTPIPDGGVTNLGLEVSADELAITVHGSPIDVPAHAQYQDGSKPNHVVWTVDDTRIGSIDGDGVFEANGFTAGSVTITGRVGSQSASVTITVTVEITESTGGISDADQKKLRQGGTGGAKGVGPDAAFRFLYPYDNTVFPKGLAAPVLQFAGAAASGTYLHITSKDYSYAAFAPAGAPIRVNLSDAEWRGLTESAGASSPVKVQVSKLSAGVVTGPIEEQWTIAQGSLKGVIYYNTYRSLLAGSDGAVMRIRPGQSAEVLRKGCTVCHAVSSHGNVMVAGVDWDKDPIDSESLDLAADGTVSTRKTSSQGLLFALGGLTPDGARVIVNGAPPDQPKPRGLAGPFASGLVDTKTGLAIAAPSFTSRVTYALTPNFSPDGSLLAFNNRDASAGHTLSVMDYDGRATPPMFSNLRTVVTSARIAAWPSFLPDSGAIAFHEGDAFDTAKYQGGALYADLRLADLSKNQVNSLAALNGYSASGAFYLPYGKAEEEHLDYEPSVLPVPVGGYYWMLFTSRRAYGNTIAPGGTVPRGGDKWGKPQGTEVESPSPRKKIWLAPIDLDYGGKVDPSHPAIYLPGQELESGNMRAFAALEPCRADGGSCESAAECCNGFCRETGRNSGGAVLQCVPPPDNSCSNEDETCATAGDCCNSRDLCINKRCATPAPEQPPVH
jgi:hypothetical protein